MDRTDIVTETEGSILRIPPDVEVHELDTIFLWFDEDGIGNIISRNIGKRTLERVQKTIESLKRIAPDEKMCMIVDTTFSSENTREARQYATKEFPTLFKALAVVSSSTFGRMVANIYVAVSSQPYPIKFFKSEQEAKEWLRQFL